MKLVHMYLSLVKLHFRQMIEDKLSCNINVLLAELMIACKVIKMCYGYKSKGQQKVLPKCGPIGCFVTIVRIRVEKYGYQFQFSVKSLSFSVTCLFLKEKLHFSEKRKLPMSVLR